MNPSQFCVAETFDYFSYQPQQLQVNKIKTYPQIEPPTLQIIQTVQISAATIKLEFDTTAVQNSIYVAHDSQQDGIYDYFGYISATTTGAKNLSYPLSLPIQLTNSPQIQNSLPIQQQLPVCAISKRPTRTPPYIFSRVQPYRKKQKQRKNWDPNCRVFGEYKCNRCNNCWQSGNSYVNEYQQCKSCLTKAYPHKWNYLDKRTNDDHVDRNKPHLEKYCGKCKRLGYSCR